MARLSYRDIPAEIAGRRNFAGNSMYGERYPGHVSHNYANGLYEVPSDARYVIFSYSTPIAWVDRDGFAQIPDHKFSMTTSRHQGIVRRSLDNDSDAQRMQDAFDNIDKIAEQRAIESITRGMAA